MPTLPGFEVSQAHYDRIVAAFPGTTGAEKLANYRRWQTNAHIDEVARLEGEKIREEMRIEEQTRLDNLAKALPARAAYPPPPPAVAPPP